MKKLTEGLRNVKGGGGNQSQLCPRPTAEAFDGVVVLRWIDTRETLSLPILSSLEVNKGIVARRDAHRIPIFRRKWVIFFFWTQDRLTQIRMVIIKMRFYTQMWTWLQMKWWKWTENLPHHSISGTLKCDIKITLRFLFPSLIWKYFLITTCKQSAR